jgi:hypothetical protein
MNKLISKSLCMLLVLPIACSATSTVVEKTTVSVAISPIKNSCSEVQLEYFVNITEGFVSVPVGKTGLESEHFDFSVLALRGENNIPMNLAKHNSKALLSEEILKLTIDDSPYKAKVDLKKLFPNAVGKYYLDYIYTFKPYKLDIRENEHTNQLWVYEFIKSDRYYIALDSNGCIVDFLNG